MIPIIWSVQKRQIPYIIYKDWKAVQGLSGAWVRSKNNYKYALKNYLEKQKYFKNWIVVIEVQPY